MTVTSDMDSGSVFELYLPAVVQSIADERGLDEAHSGTDDPVEPATPCWSWTTRR